MLLEAKKLLDEMVEEAETEKHEKIIERFQDQYAEHNELFESLKPSIERIMSDKKLMKNLE